MIDRRYYETHLLPSHQNSRLVTPLRGQNTLAPSLTHVRHHSSNRMLVTTVGGSPQSIPRTHTWVSAVAGCTPGVGAPRASTTASATPTSTGTSYHQHARSSARSTAPPWHRRHLQRSTSATVVKPAQAHRLAHAFGGLQAPRLHTGVPRRPHSHHLVTIRQSAFIQYRQFWPYGVFVSARVGGSTRPTNIFAGNLTSIGFDPLRPGPDD